MQVATGVSLFTYTRWHGSPVSVQQVIRTRSSLQHQRAQSDELRRKLKNESCSVSAPNAFESSVWATSWLPSAPARMCAVAVLVVRNRLSQLPTFSRSSPQNCSHTPCCSVGHLTKTESSACAWIGVLTLLQVHHSRCLGECIPPRPPQVPYLITTTSNNNSTNSNNTDPSCVHWLSGNLNTVLLDVRLTSASFSPSESSHRSTKNRPTLQRDVVSLRLASIFIIHLNTVSASNTFWCLLFIVQ